MSLFEELNTRFNQDVFNIILGYLSYDDIKKCVENSNKLTCSCKQIKTILSKNREIVITFMTSGSYSDKATRCNIYFNTTVKKVVLKILDRFKGRYSRVAKIEKSRDEEDEFVYKYYDDVKKLIIESKLDNLKELSFLLEKNNENISIEVKLLSEKDQSIYKDRQMSKMYYPPDSNFYYYDFDTEEEELKNN